MTHRESPAQVSGWTITTRPSTPPTADWWSKVQPRWGVPLPVLWMRLRRNWLFAVVLGLGFALRLITWLAYQPALLYIDSFRYLANLGPMAMDRLDPIGYTLVLWPLLLAGKQFGAGMAFTTAIQHLLGLAIAVVIYRICRGLGVARWVAAVITTPVLLDGYELQIEQSLMAEVWSDAFLLAAVWLLLAWRLRQHNREQTTGQVVGFGPLWWQAGLAGLLIGANVPIRVVGAAAVVPFVAYLIFGGARWRDRGWRRAMAIRLAAGLAGFGIMLGGYMAASRGDTAPGGLSDGGALLYGRAAEVAKCGQLPLDRYLAEVCPTQPLGQRLGVDTYAWHPMVAHYLPPDGTQAELKIEFTKLVIERQPLDIAGAMVHDFLKGFSWTKRWSPGDMPPSRWQFQTAYPRWPATDANPWTLHFDRSTPHVTKTLATFLRGYQLSIGYTPGTLLGVAGLVALAGILRKPDGGTTLRAESLLVVGIALALVGGAAVFEFSWRYQLPGLVFFPLAAAIGLRQLDVPCQQPRSR
jgi:hypothetical protein